MAQKKYVSLTRLSNFLDNIKAKYSQIGHKHTVSDLTDYKVDTTLSSTSSNPIANKAVDAEFEAVSQAMGALESAIDGKSDSTHTHDDRYYTETEIDQKLSAVNTSIDNIKSGEIVVKEAEHAGSADSATTANSANHATTAGSADNATHAESADSATNANHATTADSATSATKATQDASGNVITSTYETKTDATAKLNEAKSYTDTKTANLASTSTVDTKITTHNTSTTAHSDIRDLISGLTTRLNTLANSDDTTLDQMSEVVAYIKNNKSLIDGITTSKVNVADIVNNLTTNVANKPLSAAQGVAIKTLIDALQEELDSHTHAIADVSGLQSALDGKAASSHGTHVTYSTTAPVMDGTASVGTATTVARSDHKHPTDTSRASKTEFDSHTADTTKHITATERTNWNAAKTHADSAHAPSNAQPNQNAFSNIKVGTTTVAADTTTDTLTLEGSNITITPDATNDKVTFSILDASTSNKGVVQLTNSTSSTSTTTAATPSSVKSTYDLANTAKTNAATAQSRADSAYSLAESKVDSLSDLGITATATELNYMDGVTSNVQTQIDNKADSGMIAYGTCSTAADVAEKVVTTTNGNFELKAGAIIHVKFTNVNTKTSVKLNIDGCGAKGTRRYGSWGLEGEEWKAGQVVKFVYDGSVFYMEGANTTIEAGGTGADNVEDARANLSLYSREDHEWTLLYDSGETNGNVNSFSGISVAGYKNIAVAVKCVNTNGNSAAKAGSIYISTQSGVKYQFPVLTNLFSTSANTTAGFAIFNRVNDYLVCSYAGRHINAPNFLKTPLGGTADNLTPVGGGIMRCISPMSSVIVSSLDQNASYYFGSGSRVMVWGWNA